MEWNAPCQWVTPQREENNVTKVRPHGVVCAYAFVRGSPVGVPRQSQRAFFAQRYFDQLLFTTKTRWPWGAGNSGMLTHVPVVAVLLF